MALHMDIQKQDIDYLDCWNASIFIKMFWFCIRFCIVEDFALKNIKSMSCFQSTGVFVFAFPK